MLTYDTCCSPPPLPCACILPVASAANQPLCASSLHPYFLVSVDLTTRPLPLLSSPPSASLCSDTPLCPPHRRRRQTPKHTDNRAPTSRPTQARNTDKGGQNEDDCLTFSLDLLPSVFVCSRTVSLPSFFLLLLLCLLLSQTCCCCCCCRVLPPPPPRHPPPSSTSLKLFLATAAEHTEDLGFAWGAEGPSSSSH